MNIFEKFRLTGRESIGHRRTFYGILLAGIVVMIVLHFLTGNYITKLGYSVFMYIALAGAWNYLSGFTGYITFGPTMFFALGGYTMGLAIQNIGLDWYMAIPVVVIVGALTAAFFGYVLLRISGAYFVVGTFMLAEALRQLSLVARDITGGSTGMVATIIPQDQVYYLFLGLAVLTTVITYETATSGFGRRMIAIREDEEVLGTLGINPLKYKLTAFVVHGIITSVAGSLFVLSLGLIYPNVIFNVQYTISIVIIVILGSMATVWGPVIGAMILIPVQEAFWLEFPELFLLIYGIFLMLIIVLMPEGIIKRLKRKGILPRSRGV